MLLLLIIIIFIAENLSGDELCHVKYCA